MFLQPLTCGPYKFRPCPFQDLSIHKLPLPMPPPFVADTLAVHRPMPANGKNISMGSIISLNSGILRIFTWNKNEKSISTWKQNTMFEKIDFFWIILNFYVNKVISIVSSHGEWLSLRLYFFDVKCYNFLLASFHFLYILHFSFSL